MGQISHFPTDSYMGLTTVQHFHKSFIRHEMVANKEIECLQWNNWPNFKALPVIDHTYFKALPVIDHTYSVPAIIFTVFTSLPYQTG